MKIVGLIILALIIFISIVASITIFGAQEASVNMTNSSYYDQYNSTTTIVSYSMSFLNAGGLLLIVGILIAGLAYLYHKIS